ncbi:MAG: menaquinone biosynthesis decarboxylase [Candidatus Acidiferrales bacterium]
MAYRDLRDFLSTLEKHGELRRISAEVDPVLEITEITDRAIKAGGPALLFERPKGSRIPVVTNLVGSERRMNLALEVDSLDEVAERVKSFIDVQSPQGILEKLKLLPKLAEIGSFFPKSVRSGACQEVVRTEGISLREFPILKCWPQDGGRYITWPMVITKNPETGKRNVGTYRMQVFDERSTGMHWQTQKHGADHYRSARAKHGHGKLDVAVAIGSDPATALAGILPVPPDMDEFLFSGFLRRDPVELVACKTVDLEVPANAEIVLEGFVEIGETRTEGPFGDHTGFYSLEGQYPVFHLTCITHRQDPLYLTTIVGPPPQEDYFMGHAIERVFLPVMKMQYPEIVDVAMPAEGIFQNLMIVAIRKSYPGQARKIMNAIWSLGQAMFTKVVVVVDHDVDVQNSSEVVWKALCAIDPERDVQFVLGPVDSLDHAARRQDFGSKMGVDATRKFPEEGFSGRWPDEIKMDEATKKRMDSVWQQLKISGTKKKEI